jgi:phosphopantothenoylcysteine decarboxylase/phosphopantothenate--cysteine ligase
MSKQRRMLITAGPTHEPIDAVRYLANRSSGRLGICLADAARSAGWKVVLLLGPTSLEPPTGVETHRFQTAADLQQLLAGTFEHCDVLIMAAAVADYRPAGVSEQKLPRRAEGLTLKLEATADLVAACVRRKRTGQRIIGFALEEDAQLEARAQEKLRRKGLDAIVANPLQTMGAKQMTATVFTADGASYRPMDAAVDKAGFAAWLVAWVGHEFG